MQPPIEELVSAGEKIHLPESSEFRFKFYKQATTSGIVGAGFDGAFFRKALEQALDAGMSASSYIAWAVMVVSICAFLYGCLGWSLSYINLKKRMRGNF